MQKSLSTSELVELQTIFDTYKEKKNACLSRNEQQESLNDFVCEYRDNDEWQTVEQYKTAVLERDAWQFKCNIDAPADPNPRARRLEKGREQNGMGYIYKTTFANDFTIADHFGVEAVRDTYKRAFNEWQRDCVYFTELVLVLNWKIWEHYENEKRTTGATAAKHDKLGHVYNDLWNAAAIYAEDNLKGAELQYYFETTD